MTNFTQAFLSMRNFFPFLILLLGINLLQAQTHTLTITAPAAIAGKYDINIAAFGSTTCSFDTIKGAVVLGTDSAGSSLACSRILTDLTGKIVLIDRGDCNFTDKALRAQQRGAAAVVIINNNSAPLNGALFTIGVTSPQVPVPTFSMSLPNGTSIKAGLTGTVSGLITRKNDDVVVWGAKPGEGDFRNGLNGWTSNTISCSGPGPDTLKVWHWSANAISRGGCGKDTLLSPTACNGAAVFESDFYDSNGAGCGGTFVGKGLCPAPQVGELISPNMDVSASNSPNDFSLKFYQVTASFTGNKYFVAWSKNNGTTWDSIAINNDIEPNTSSDNPDVKRITLTGTAGADNLRVKFVWTANYYEWIIDDVEIVERPSNDLSVNPFYAVSPNSATPLAHVEPIPFLADIQNVGTAAQTNVNLKAEVFYRASATSPITSVFTTTRPYGNVPAGALIENRLLPQQYTPNARGTYFGEYSISATDADADITNNTQEFAFAVTDSLFAKDLSGPNDAYQPGDGSPGWTGAEHSWAWGQYYYVPNAANNYIRNVSFAISADNTVKDKEILINIYKWLGDTNENEQADPNERVSVGFATYTIKGTERATSLITVPFPNREDPPVKLDNNTAYLVMIEYYADDANNFYIGATNEIDYSGMIVATDSLKKPRYAGMLGVNSNLAEEAYSTVGFDDGTGTNNGYRIQPVVRMSVGAALTSTKELNVLENKFKVFPNPTSDLLNVQLNLDKPAQTAIVRLFDLSGKMLQQWKYDNIQKERLEYNVNSLNSGTYFLQVITEDGAGTKKFNVIK